MLHLDSGFYVYLSSFFLNVLHGHWDHFYYFAFEPERSQASWSPSMTSFMLKDHILRYLLLLPQFSTCNCCIYFESIIPQAYRSSRIPSAEESQDVSEDCRCCYWYFRSCQGLHHDSLVLVVIYLFISLHLEDIPHN